MTTPETTTKNKLKLTAEPGKQEIFITREFDAPRALVFRAYTGPDLIKQWLGPRGMTMEIERFDARTGGGYRYTHIDPKGNRFVFNGVMHEITPERMIQTFEYEGLPTKGHVSLDTLLLEELPGGRTKLTIHSVFRSVEDRDGMITAGMEYGVREGFERLEALLPTLNN